MSFEQGSDQFRNSDLNFFFTFDFLIDHFDLFFIDFFLTDEVFGMGFFLITAFQKFKNLFWKGTDLLFIQETWV